MLEFAVPSTWLLSISAGPLDSIQWHQIIVAKPILFQVEAHCLKNIKAKKLFGIDRLHVN